MSSFKRAILCFGVLVSERDVRKRRAVVEAATGAPLVWDEFPDEDKADPAGLDWTELSEAMEAKFPRLSLDHATAWPGDAASTPAMLSVNDTVVFVNDAPEAVEIKQPSKRDVAHLRAVAKRLFGVTAEPSWMLAPEET